MINPILSLSEGLPDVSHLNQQFPCHPTNQKSNFMEEEVEEENAVEQTEDVNIPMFTHNHPFLALFDPPQVTTDSMIYPFPQPSQVVNTVTSYVIISKSFRGLL